MLIIYLHLGVIQSIRLANKGNVVQTHLGENIFGAHVIFVPSNFHRAICLKNSQEFFFLNNSIPFTKVKQRAFLYVNSMQFDIKLIIIIIKT